MNHRPAATALVTVASLQAICPSASAQNSADAVYLRFHDAQVLFENARVTAVSNGTALGQIAIVTPGATITVEADYIILFSEDPNSYTFCPNCNIQNYVAWLPDAVAAGASPVNVGLWNGQSTAPGIHTTTHGSTQGHFSFTTTVPTEPGEYYIGCGETLDFNFSPSATGSGGWDANLGIVGPPECTSFLISVVSVVPAQCQGDANGDGVVDFNDITATLGSWLNVCF